MVSPSETRTTAARGRVLLTGAHGFTGVHLRAELEAAGYVVVGAVVGMPAGPHEVALDITSLDNCRNVMEAVRPDYLVHLAAVSFVQQCGRRRHCRIPAAAAGQPLRGKQAGDGAHGANVGRPFADRDYSSIQLHRDRTGAAFPGAENRFAFHAARAGDRVGQS